MLIFPCFYIAKILQVVAAVTEKFQDVTKLIEINPYNR